MASSLSPRKRPSPVEFDDISSISAPTDGPAAKIHGVVTALSPIKPTSNKPYFEGYLSDGHKRMRFVGFSSAKEKLITKFNKDNNPILLSNCTVKNARFGDGLEIIVGDGTTIEKSSKEFDVDLQQEVVATSTTTTTKLISLSDLNDQPAYQRITVTVKVIDISTTKVLDDNRVVQNILVSDNKTTAKVALWQDFVDSVTLGKSYKLINFAVKKHENISTLFTPKRDAEIEDVEDVTDAIEVASSQIHTRTLEDVKVIAVTELILKRTCVSCRKGHVTSIEDTPSLGRCSACPTTVVMDSCPTELSAIITVKSKTFTFKLFTSGEHLVAIANVTNLDEVTDMNLLLSSPFTAVYATNNMSITTISR